MCKVFKHLWFCQGYNFFVVFVKKIFFCTKEMPKEWHMFVRIHGYFSNKLHFITAEHLPLHSNVNWFSPHQCYPFFMNNDFTAPASRIWSSGPRCSKLTMLLVNFLLKFQTLIHVSQICQYFLLKKCEKLLLCKSFSLFFFQQKISVYLVVKLKNT